MTCSTFWALWRILRNSRTTATSWRTIRTPPNDPLKLRTFELSYWISRCLISFFFHYKPNMLTTWEHLNLSGVLIIWSITEFLLADNCALLQLTWLDSRQEERASVAAAGGGAWADPQRERASGGGRATAATPPGWEGHWSKTAKKKLKNKTPVKKKQKKSLQKTKMRKNSRRRNWVKRSWFLSKQFFSEFTKTLRQTDR